MRLLWVVAATGVLALSACATPAEDREIESLLFHQYQAIEDFDDSDYSQDDPAQIARFQELLDEYDVTPGVTVTTVEDNCAGGMSTTVEISYTTGDPVEMFIAACGEPKYDEFNTQATALFTEWRESHNSD